MPPAGIAPSRCGDARSAGVVPRDARSIARPPQHPRPGRPSPHRLNRAEYANAVRDLLGARGRRVQRCCRRTIRRTASTTTPTCSACRPRCSSVISRRRPRSARSRSAARRSRRARRRTASAETRRRRVRTSSAAGHTRRPDGHAHVPAGRRIRHQGQAAGDQPGCDPRPRVSSTSSRSPSTANVCSWRRSAGPKDYTRVVAQRHQRRQLARRAAAGARARARRPAPGRRGVSAEAAPRRAAIGCSRSCAARSSRPITLGCRTSRT